MYVPSLQTSGPITDVMFRSLLPSAIVSTRIWSWLMGLSSSWKPSWTIFRLATDGEPPGDSFLRLLFCYYVFYCLLLTYTPKNVHTYIPLSRLCRQNCPSFVGHGFSYRNIFRIFLLFGEWADSHDIELDDHWFERLRFCIDWPGSSRRLMHMELNVFQRVA